MAVDDKIIRIRVQAPTTGMPNHDARFQYCLLGAFVFLISILCVFGEKLDAAQVGLIGGGIGTLAGLLKQTQYLDKRSGDNAN